MKFEIFKTLEFDEDFKNLEKFEKLRVEKILLQLSENGDMVGKPLSFKFFKEKKFDGKRVLFLVYEELNAILAVTIVGKKSQQNAINAIIAELPFYKEFIKEQIRKKNY